MFESYRTKIAIKKSLRQRDFETQLGREQTILDAAGFYLNSVWCTWVMLYWLAILVPKFSPLYPPDDSVDSTDSGVRMATTLKASEP